MPEKVQVKWYLRPITIFIAILAAGPLALPLIWLSPVFKRWQKVVIALLVIIFTLWAFRAAADLYQLLLKEAQELQGVLK